MWDGTESSHCIGWSRKQASVWDRIGSGHCTGWNRKQTLYGAEQKATPAWDRTISSNCIGRNAVGSSHFMRRRESSRPRMEQKAARAGVGIRADRDCDGRGSSYTLDGIGSSQCMRGNRNQTRYRMVEYE
jgi:hypothetical protein